MSTTVTLTAGQAEAMREALAQFDAAADAPTTPAPVADAEVSPFVGWLRETAEARKARSTRNREVLAPMLDAKRAGWRAASNRSAIWDAAKAGKRLPAVKA